MKDQYLQVQLQKLLTEKFNIPDINIKGAKSFRPTSAIEVGDVFRPIFPNEDEYLELWDYGNFEEQLGIQTSSLLGFEYFSMGPMSFSHSLFIYRFGWETSYVAYKADSQDPVIIFAYDTNDHLSIVPQFLRTFYASNGTRYGLDGVFWNLPSTTNIYDKVITVELAYELYRIFLNSETIRNPHHSAWADEMDENERLNAAETHLEYIKKIFDKFSTDSLNLESLEDRALKSLNTGLELDEKEKKFILFELLAKRTDFIYL